ncbi:class I SAM-dependent methyltransferase [Viridibacillus arvi]|uniref:class I SAM-dependent methyltransferase n=1 Tax=Viridibacillus arvi TaxID=263475 RepID=UPI00187BB087|nr:class I SAM-dependent methyltransferase [Viridibacillus sp. JNUCC-6]QOV13075.1 methyltransferase domain-containing protein [Viridibacillus sp. JNUCC-6]
MKLQRVLQYTKDLLADTVVAGDSVVDATAGNGHDTAFLAELVGTTGHVYAFDVQQQAVDATKLRLEENQLDKQATVILDGHQNVKHYVSKPIKAAIFNLGYLPGSEHSIVTKPGTTIEAISDLLDLLHVGGMIILVVYHGHEGGKDERDKLLAYVSDLPQKYVHVLRYEFINQKNDPPFIIALEKMKDLP